MDTETTASSVGLAGARRTPSRRADESKEDPTPTKDDIEKEDEAIMGQLEDEEEDEGDVGMSDEEAHELSHGAPKKPAKQGGKHAISCTHPRGVKPLGNALFDPHPSIRGPGFGRLARCYTDSSLLDLVRTHLTVADLVVLQRVSKAFYILANEEEVWKEQVLAAWEGAFRFRVDWKNTCAYMRARDRASATAASAGASVEPPFVPLPAPLKFPGFYSDEIFQSFYCAHIDLQSSYGDTADNIPRIHYSEMTPERFREEFGKPNRPVIITGMMDQWACYGPAAEFDATRWTVDNWSAKYADQPFKIGRYTMQLKAYFEYMSAIQSDESPLYLFDSKFGEKHPEMLREYSVPAYFHRDLFDLLNHDTKVRPNFRWILVGPQRSGSTFHKDPNHTSAWNALISGHKKWIMYDRMDTPPGIFPSANGAEVATPISVAEWFINNYPEHRRRVDEYEERMRYEREVWERNQRKQKEKEQEEKSQPATKKPVESASGPPAAKKTKLNDSTAAVAAVCAPPVVPSSSSSSSSSPPWRSGPVEATCHPGEIIFIPNGWWHTALNLTASFAVTQNYVNEENLWNVCEFLQEDEGEQERNHELLGALTTELERHHPALAAEVDEKKVEKEIARVEKEEEEARRSKKKKSTLWERLTS